MERKNISLLQNGDKIREVYLIKDVTCRLTNGSNNKFLDINLIDRTGMINAKLWKCSEEQAEQFKTNKLIKICGNVLDWKGKLQIKIDSFDLIENMDEYDLDIFIPTAPYKSEKMIEHIQNEVSNIENKDIKRLLEYVLEDKKKELLYYPAAKSNHHAIKGGLLYHTVTMMRSAHRLCEVYNFLNRDLLMAGIILHDISKIEEMNANELGLVNEYSIEGQLLGHITMGVRYVERISKELNIDKEVSMLIQHMILSHHYEAEYGSPKKPMIPEAELLHYLDIMDARMYDMKKAIENCEKGTFSEKIYSLDGICVYKHKL